MAQRGKMLHRLADPLGVIHLDHANVGKVRSVIHKDQRKLAFHQLLHQLFLNSKVITATPSTLRCSMRRISDSVRASSWLVEPINTS